MDGGHLRTSRVATDDFGADSRMGKATGGIRDQGSGDEEDRVDGARGHQAALGASLQQSGRGARQRSPNTGYRGGNGGGK